jgi:LPXTG-site transpeptidase (sortase) family protein
VWRRHADILCVDMTGQEDPWTKEPVVPDLSGQSEAVRPDASGASGTAGSNQSTGRRRRKHHPWYWWLANLMIVWGILAIPGYYLGTCAYTSVNQNRLEEQLTSSNPQIATAATDVNEKDYFSYATVTSTTLAPNPAPDQATAAEAAIAAAKAERDAKLAAFKAAADAFAAKVSGQIGEPIGKIVIPAIGLDVVLIEGTGVRDLKEGPGHWEETPFPGQVGNFVVSGHRTTYGAPFFKLNELKPGDEIVLVLPYAICRYTVTETLIVYPKEVDTVASVGREQISLAACHPIYSAKQRIVVKGELSTFKLIEATAP